MPPTRNNDFTTQHLDPYNYFGTSIASGSITTASEELARFNMAQERARQELRAMSSRSMPTPVWRDMTELAKPVKAKKSTIDFDAITKKNTEVFKKVEVLRKDMTKLHIDFVREHVANKDVSPLIFIFSRMNVKTINDKVIEALANNFRPAFKETRLRFKTKAEFSHYFNNFFRNRVMYEDKTQEIVDTLINDLWEFSSIVANVDTELDKLTGKTKVKNTVCEDYLPNSSRYEADHFEDDDLF